MPNTSLTITGGDTTYFYGPTDDLDRSIDRDSIVHLAGGVYTDQSPLRLPRLLSIGEGTTLRLEEE